MCVGYGRRNGSHHLPSLEETITSGTTRCMWVCVSDVCTSSRVICYAPGFSATAGATGSLGAATSALGFSVVWPDHIIGLRSVRGGRLGGRGAVTGKVTVGAVLDSHKVAWGQGKHGWGRPRHTRGHQCQGKITQRRAGVCVWGGRGRRELPASLTFVSPLK